MKYQKRYHQGIFVEISAVVLGIPLYSLKLLSVTVLVSYKTFLQPFVIIHSSAYNQVKITKQGRQFYSHECFQIISVCCTNLIIHIRIPLSPSQMRFESFCDRVAESQERCSTSSYPWHVHLAYHPWSSHRSQLACIDHHRCFHCCHFQSRWFVLPACQPHEGRPFLERTLWEDWVSWLFHSSGDEYQEKREGGEDLWWGNNLGGMEESTGRMTYVQFQLSYREYRPPWDRRALR